MPCPSGLLSAHTGGGGKFLSSSLHGNGVTEGCVLGTFLRETEVHPNCDNQSNFFPGNHNTDIFVMISLITNANSTLFYIE